ncbi:MAG: hypothetical protein WKF66_06885 [Pedobacter sp.]
MKKVIDSTLSAELQELYLENKEWLSDLLYLQDEMRFFKKLFNQILSTGVEREHLLKLEMITSSMNCIKNRRTHLKTLLESRKSQLSQLLQGNDVEIKIEFIEEDAAIVLEINSIMLAETVLKNELFKLSKHQRSVDTLLVARKPLRVKRYPLL